MKNLPTLLCIIAFGAIVGCTQNDDDAATAAPDSLGPGEVAIVNGTRIPESVFRLHTLNTLQVDADSLTPEGRLEV
ncbi:MAG: hypothetical protein HKN13_08480, partial [Rhodothermales bacterium]|nr:hypothetical protein [Rhodothermales bacterium]